MEHGAEGVSELLDLQIARCKLMTARVKDRATPQGRIKVATKFVNLAKTITPLRAYKQTSSNCMGRWSWLLAGSGR